MKIHDHKKLAPKISKNAKNYLKFTTANHMIDRLLTCNRIKFIPVKYPKYTKKELAKKLGITTKELQNLKKKYYYKNIAHKINLPLISLYCATKWKNPRPKKIKNIMSPLKSFTIDTK